MATKHKAAKRPTRARKPKAGARRSARASLSIATNASKKIKERLAEMAAAPLAVCESDKDLQGMLGVLRNKEEPVEVRMAALQALGAAAFSVIAFESCHADYIATLRQVATDPNPKIRSRVLGILIRNKDGFAEKKLLEGLKNPDKALVPPEKALQLLGYDVHTEAYPIARKIINAPPNAEAKREAVRLLAADAKSAPLFEKLLRDKDELREIRQISAAALQALRPDKLQEHAREILLDKSDYNDIKATSLTALGQFGDDAALENDKSLLKSVGRIRTGKGPAKYKQSARRFLSKFDR